MMKTVVQLRKKSCRGGRSLEVKLNLVKVNFFEAPYNEVVLSFSLCVWGGIDER